jgi:hypothetical protein
MNCWFVQRAFKQIDDARLIKSWISYLSETAVRMATPQ